MATFNYNKFKSLADDKLAYYGNPIILQDAMDVLKDDTMRAIFSQPREENIPQSLIGTVKGMFTCTMGQNVATLDDYLVWNGLQYKILNINRVNLTDTDILVQFLVSV